MFYRLAGPALKFETRRFPGGFFIARCHKGKGDGFPAIRRISAGVFAKK
jgi:hypothetical protein